MHILTLHCFGKTLYIILKLYLYPNGYYLVLIVGFIFICYIHRLICPVAKWYILIYNMDICGLTDIYTSLALGLWVYSHISGKPLLFYAYLFQTVGVISTNCTILHFNELIQEGENQLLLSSDIILIKDAEMTMVQRE